MPGRCDTSVAHRLYRQLAGETYDWAYLAVLLTLEFALCWIILERVAYTEIDWVAYMQEVEAYLDGERDYTKIRGDTGPLVYPAGFLYLFSLLRRWTRNGSDIRTAQHAFLGFYLATQLAAMLIYQSRVLAVRRERIPEEARTRQIWSWRIAMGVLCLSKRLHSIFLLRLFNDGPTMLLLYVSVFLFGRQYWDLGCVVFSLAVSIKMNVLLFAPGLLLLLLQTSPDLWTVMRRLLLGCALPQLLLGAPFLTTYPVSYLRKAFELDRVFFFEWTVNWKFLPEKVFVSKELSVLLLVLHLTVLGICASTALRATAKQLGGRTALFLQQPLSTHYITYALFASNFVGICFARTLHYQFYSWYFHTLPYLLWTAVRDSPGKLAIRLLLLGGIESSFLTFPATPRSSLVLQVCHFVVLAAVLFYGCPAPTGVVDETPAPWKKFE